MQRLLKILTNSQDIILNFNEESDNIERTNYNISDIGRLRDFRELQLSLVVEFEIDRDMKDPERKRIYVVINPYTGKFLFSDSKSSTNMEDCRMKKYLDNGSWKLKNLKNRVFINNKLGDVNSDLRIIWSTSALKSMLPFIDELKSSYKMNDNDHFVHIESAKKLDKNIQKIIDDETSKILTTQAELKTKQAKMIFTCGSQAAGKSSYFEYPNPRDESFIKYGDTNYYNVDSDRYLSEFDLTIKLNNFPITYENSDNKRWVNSYKRINEVIGSKKYTAYSSPHKHIEYELEQMCVNNSINFVKQGTELWLRHLNENDNFAKYTKLILFFWIPKSLMLERLYRRLSNLRDIRYFYDTNSALKTYDKDWTNSAKAIMIHYFNNIFTFDKKYSFCIILSDENKEKGTRDSTCFRIKNDKFDVTKQGVINVKFFIQLLLYLTEHNLSDITKDVLLEGKQKLETPREIPEQNYQILKEMLTQTTPKPPGQKTPTKPPGQKSKQRNNKTFFDSFAIEGVQKTKIMYDGDDDNSDDDNAAANIARIIGKTATRVGAPVTRVEAPVTRVEAPAATGFGFGAQAPATTGFGFGAQAPAATGYPPATTGFGFGGPAATGFVPPAATWYTPVATGYPPAATGYGAQATREFGGFGTPAPADTGFRPAATGYGFGAPAATGYGFGAPTNTRFRAADTWRRDYDPHQYRFGGGQVIGGKNTKKHFNYHNKNKIKNTSRKH
jgi:hypothetical protein